MFGNKKLLLFISVVVLAFYLGKSKQTRKGKIIETKCGKIEGIISESRDGREFYEWFKVPYAKPPIGHLRFASPEPIGKWEGVRDGRVHGPQCAQNFMHSPRIVLGDEDCLYLNIHTPKKLLDEHKRLPVLLFIHGGGFVMGSSSDYAASYLMDENVVMVSIQYRLGILGFLSTGDGVIRGNMGLKDQVQALKWVKENIQNFGGDPNKVTVFGQSAGAASVQHLLLSPMTKGLIHKGISLSGSVTSPWGFISPVKSLEKTEIVAKALGCPLTRNSDEIAACLRNASLEDVLKSVWQDLNENNIFQANKVSSSFVPTIEKVEDEETFLGQHPLEAVAQGKAAKVPWMVGHTAHEMNFQAIQLVESEIREKEFLENRKRILEHIFSIEPSPNVSSAEKSERIYNLYFPSTTQSSLTRDQRLERYTEMFGDGGISFDIHASILHQRQFSPVFPYFYNKTGGLCPFELIGLFFSGTFKSFVKLALYSAQLFVSQIIFGTEPPTDDKWVDHFTDTAQLFPIPLFEITTANPNYQFSKSYVKLLVDFAADASPLKFRGVSFPPTPKEGPFKFLKITNDVPQIIMEPFLERMKFLRDLKTRNIQVNNTEGGSAKEDI